MTRISISHIGKCHGNHWEVAGGCELTIAKSSGFFVFCFCFTVFVFEEPKFFSPWVLFFTINFPLT